MKKVKDLIEFLKTQDPEMPIQIIYDTFESNVNIFVTKSKRLCISNDDYDPEVEDYVKVLFYSKTERSI